MASRASSRSHTKLDVMEKRIPKNPRYDEVQPVVDTGASMSKYLKRIEDIRTNYRIRKDELFKRMKVTTFIQLMIQVAEINAIEREAQDEGTGDLATPLDSARPETGDSDQRASEGSETSVGETPGRTQEVGEGSPREPDQEKEALSELMTTRSTLEGITRGVGEFDVRGGVVGGGGGGGHSAPVPRDDDVRPYLLLDVRSPDEFDQCHLITAQSYPIAMLSRSVNYETREMLAYRNQPGKIIVLYDEDERIAPKAATTMVERGYDNLFLLSGGMKVAYKFFPGGLLTGAPPPTLASPPKNNNKKQAPPPATPIRPDFTHNDLFLLNQQLDDALDDKTQSSRMSRATTEASRSRVSQMSSRSTTSTVGTVTSQRPPFR